MVLAVLLVELAVLVVILAVLVLMVVHQAEAVEEEVIQQSRTVLLT